MVLQVTGQHPGSPGCLARAFPTLETQMTPQPLCQPLTAASQAGDRRLATASNRAVALKPGPVHHVPLSLPDGVSCPASPNTLSASCSSSYFACPAILWQPLAQPFGHFPCLAHFSPLSHIFVFKSSSQSQPPPCHLLSSPGPLITFHPYFQPSPQYTHFFDPILSILPNSHSQVKTKSPQHFPNARRV